MKTSGAKEDLESRIFGEEVKEEEVKEEEAAANEEEEEAEEIDLDDLDDLLYERMEGQYKEHHDEAASSDSRETTAKKIAARRGSSGELKDEEGAGEFDEEASDHGDGVIDRTEARLKDDRHYAPPPSPGRDDQHPRSLSRKELAARLVEMLARSEQVDVTLLAEYNDTFRDNSFSAESVLSAPDPEALDRQEQVGPGPGAFRVVPGRYVERASEAYTSSDDSFERHEDGPAPPPPPVMRAESSDARTFLVEANLVEEEPNEPAPAPLLVEATPIRRKRQLAISALLALTVIVMLIGLSVGLTSRSTPPLTPAPASAPTRAPEDISLLRAAMPPYTQDSLRNESSPQRRAYEWATEVDQVPMMEAPTDVTRRLERMVRRFALATLFYATGGDSVWTYQRGWLNSTTSECQWLGCSCYTNEAKGCSADQLDEINLASNMMQGSLPREIGLLSSLVFLSLRDNELTGAIPSTVGNLTNLGTLDLSYNRLTVLPTTIGLLSALSSLDASWNSFSGGFRIEICQLSALVSLSLQCGTRNRDGCSSGTGLTGPIPTELGRLSRLTALDLSWNQLSRIPTEIGLLNNLLSLDFTVNALAGTIPLEIGLLSALTFLDVSVNLLSSSMPTQLGRLTELEYFDLYNNLLTGPIPTELGQLSRITRLDLSDMRLNSTIPTHLGRLSKLQSLGIGQDSWDVACELTGPIPTEFAVLSSLRSLRLSSTRLNSTIPTEIGLLVKLEDLTLSNNSLIGPIPTEIGRLSALSYLDVSYNNLRLTIPTELSFLTKLESIDLSSNALTGAIPTEISKLASLSSLDSSSNLLNWTIPTHLGLLTALESIDISDNSMSGTIPSELGRLSALTRLFLSSNQLTSTIPTELGLLTGLQLVLLGRNGLTGSVPSEVCQLTMDGFSILVFVDCREVACDCNCFCAENAADDSYGYYGDGAE
jgi:Leucine-rich repeat (LRR) protein